ncbi:MAG: HEPN domain-containing protein [Candidatus Methanoperedens sp.]|nr:HEPN domain-containing protein [Candidatus Methanoperedens sp.]MCZ7371231.1 HEPN domain-containing protein [Candidatus Methanoperedens sp.]
MDNKDVAKKWFNKANNDLITVEYLFTMQSPPTDIICFHSQQVAEKYLKGFLAFQGKEAPKIHDLEELISICKEIDSKFTDFYDIASELSGYAVEVRYPLEEDYEITFEEAQLAFKNAKKIKEFVLTRLKSKLS